MGKEAKEFDLVQAGLIDDEEEMLTVYRRDPKELKPRMTKMPVEEIMRITGRSRRMAYAIKAGKRRPQEGSWIKSQPTLSTNKVKPKSLKAR
ncbi:MAG: hypothetical protein M1347_06365 [Chloroflexi bacterium]|nr:hypothetical protein [Chloroflexota bacterium]